MAQSTDIVLNSAGYMIQPGSPQSPGYKRLQDGFPEGLTQRTSITDFFGGQRRSHQLERDKFGDSLAVGPALGGQGVTPWAFELESTVSAMAPHALNISCLKKIPQVVVRDRIYYALGNTLMAGPETHPSGLPATAVVKTYSHPITDITIYGSLGILICFGNAADIIWRNVVANTETTLFTGERGTVIEAFNGYAVWVEARTGTTPTILRLVKSTGFDHRHVSYDVFAMAPVGGELMLITKQALFTFTGRPRDVLVPNPGFDPEEPGSSPTMPGSEWSGEFNPFYQQGVYTEQSDFTFVLGYGGRTIAWISGGVHELTPTGDRAGWRSTGLTGRRCFGGCVAAGFLLVSIESENNFNEVWAYDGNGWWCIARQAMPANLEGVWCWPFASGGTHTPTQRTVAFFRHGIGGYTYFRLITTHDPTNNDLVTSHSAEGHFITPLIDADDRDKLKAWRKLGAVFSSPETQGFQGSTDPVTVFLDYSTDSGQS